MKTIVLSPESTLEDGLAAINQFHSGYVVAVDKAGRLMGTLTDGDLRRAILNGSKKSDLLEPLINKTCVFVFKNAGREQILRLFDQRVKFVPVLDDENRVIRIETVENLHYSEAKDLVAKSKAPSRISFGGGGTDLTPFFVEHGGAVLNATINLYSRATLKKHSIGSNVKLHSEDFNITVVANSWEDLKLDGNLDLIKVAIKRLRPTFGFDLTVASDFPPSSGLGGSSVVLAAIIGAFNQFRDDKLSNYDIAELAFQAERLDLGYSGGWQDQYAAVFGGVNFMEFRKDRNEINSLKIHPDTINELEDRLVICYTGNAHPINSIHKSQAKNITSDTKAISFAHQTRDLAFAMKNALQRGQLDQLGEMLDQAWQLKKSMADAITNSDLDEIYNFAKTNGAVGGKILGAGGGGYFLFQAQPFMRRHLIKSLNSKGFTSHTVEFESNGLQSWLVK